MKAAILTQQHAPLVLADVEPPAELRFGQVRVRVHYSGICGSQIGEIDGAKGPDRYLPHLLGHEGSGTVLETGEGVSIVEPGDRVVLHWMRGEGHEGPPPEYTWDGKPVNAGWVTTFNEQAVVAENRVTRIPESLDLELAALLGCAVTTGAGVVGNDARLRLGESMVVLGVGGVGLSVVQAGALSGGNPIVAVDVAEPKLKLARRLGATHVVTGSGEDVADDVRRFVGAEGADVVVDTTGIPAVIERAYELAAADGRVILVGVPPLDDRASIYTLPLHFGKVLAGSHGGQTMPSRDIPRFAALHEAGRLDLSTLITDRFPLDEINGAIDSMRAGSIAGRVVLAVSPPD